MGTVAPGLSGLRSDHARQGRWSIEQFLLYEQISTERALALDHPILEMKTEAINRPKTEAINRPRMRDGISTLRKKLLLGKKQEKFRIYLPKDRPPRSHRGYLSIVAIMRNEAIDLREWIEFHRLVGFQHLYLYDDESTDKTSEIIAPYLSEGFVTLIPWAPFYEGGWQQLFAYAHAICTFGHQWRWMALIDLDEFLFPVERTDIKDVFSRYEDLPAVAVPWQIYGSCGHVVRPEGLVIDSYTKRAVFPPPLPAPGDRDLIGWKTILEPSAVTAVDSPHLFHFSRGRGGYSERRVWIDCKRPAHWQKLTSDVLRLNHYFTKSQEDFLRRRQGDRSHTGKSPQSRKEMENAARRTLETEVQTEDRLIQRYSCELKRRISRKMA